MDETLLTLHGLALKKAGGPQDVSDRVGLPVGTATARLSQAQEAGDVAGAKGRFMLTTAGQSKLREAYPEVFADLRADPELDRAYERFEVINRELLDVFTRWQTVTRAGEQIPNDHTDERYDAGIVDELGELLERAESVLARFTAAVPRFERHPRRLDEAYDRVLAGEREYVSGAKLDSCHTRLVRDARGPAAHARTRAGGVSRWSPSTARRCPAATRSVGRRGASRGCASSDCRSRRRSCCRSRTAGCSSPKG